jgi:hypothetical protein
MASLDYSGTEFDSSMRLMKFLQPLLFYSIAAALSTRVTQR